MTHTIGVGTVIYGNKSELVMAQCTLDETPMFSTLRYLFSGDIYLFTENIPWYSPIVAGHMPLIRCGFSNSDLGAWRNLDVFLENVLWFFQIKMSCLDFILSLIVWVTLSKIINLGIP